MSEPLLSVCLITYNHIKYIKQAIDGVLMQKVDFSWELIIADDFSTDGTREIVLEYKEKYPELIKLILREKNVGPALNFIDLISAPSSKYLAYLEGDDYWTDPLKLQKQVDFLEMHPECTICFHQTLRIYEDQEKEPYFIVKFSGNQIFKKEHLYTDCIIQSCSVLYRRIPVGDYFEQSAKLRVGDWPLFVYLAQFGDIGYLDEVMSVYRVHSQGVWNGFGQKGAIEVEAEVLEFFKNSDLFQPAKELYDSLFRRYYKLALISHQSNERKIADKYLLKCLSLLPHTSNIFVRFFNSLFIQMKFPKVYEYRERRRKQYQDKLPEYSE